MTALPVLYVVLCRDTDDYVFWWCVNNSRKSADAEARAALAACSLPPGRKRRYWVVRYEASVVKVRKVRRKKG